MRASRAGLTLAKSVFTRFPCRPARTDPEAVGWAMTWAPLAGLVIGAIASGVFTLARLPLDDGSSRWLAAILAVASIAVVTGALHLDGLADSADALGVRGDADAVRAAMKSPGVGAFGVVAVVFVVLTDAAAVNVACDHRLAVTALVAGAVGGRLAVTWSCRPSVRAATDSGLGAWVAGTVPVGRALFATAYAIVLVGGWTALWRHDDPMRALVVAWGALAAGVVGGELVRRLVVRRTGGLTGDVLGAVVECGAMTTYVVVALAG